ncbi:YbaK/aminoacyl-tRNA synthetase-associated domain protein [Pelomyxa schiedti]|nr:YbaK/aminoacyl-tRNA synthetase-associated domain protein [Pelomyxa schiedti]
MQRIGDEEALRVGAALRRAIDQIDAIIATHHAATVTNSPVVACSSQPNDRGRTRLWGLRALDTAIAELTKDVVAKRNCGTNADAATETNMVRRVRKLCADIGLRAEFIVVPENYYSLELEQRRAIIGAPSVHYLCKSLILENSSCTNTDCSDPLNSRFYCIIIQYTAQLQAQKVFKFVRSLVPGSKKDNYHFRMAHDEEAQQLTGYMHNAICPIGMSQRMPIILAEAISKLELDWMWLGGGEVDLKLGCCVSDFVKATGAFVVDVYKS